MTHATKAIYKLLLSDYVKVSKVSVDDMLFDEQDIFRSMDKIEVCLFSTVRWSLHLVQAILRVLKEDLVVLPNSLCNSQKKFRKWELSLLGVQNSNQGDVLSSYFHKFGHLN